MKRKHKGSVVFYAHEGPAKKNWLVVFERDGRCWYVRAEWSPLDESDAVIQALPLDCEIVLNAVNIEEAR